MEGPAKFIFYQLLRAIEYLHSLNICHRDIKAENILLESGDDFSRVIVSDFGMSKTLQNALEKMTTKCGTFAYIAPEVLDSPSGYSKEVDCWALGVLLYTSFF
jgi:serine/threonine-protein kinase Chk2